MRRDYRKFLVKDLALTMFNVDNILRYDIVLNYMAIENYYSKNKNGWIYYRKYYKNSGYDPDLWQQKFIRLIDSFEKKWESYKNISTSNITKRTRF